MLKVISSILISEELLSSMNDVLRASLVYVQTIRTIIIRR